MKKSVYLISLLVFSLLITSCSNRSSEMNEEVMQPTNTPIPLTIDIDEKIISDNYGELQLKGVLIFDEIEDENFSYSQSDETKALLLIFDAKNTSSSEIDLSNFVFVNLIYYDNFTYKSGNCYVFNNSAESDVLIPLATTKITCGIEIPNEVVENLNNTETIIIFNWTEYVFIGNYDFIEDYLEKIEKIHEEVDDILKSWSVSTTIMSTLINTNPTPKGFVDFAENSYIYYEKLSKIILDFSNINAPNYYKEQNETYLRGLTLFNDALSLCGDVDAAKMNLKNYSENLFSCSEIGGEAITILEEVDKEYGFTD